MRSAHPLLLPLSVASLVVLLVLLAVLQYQWTGELSEADRERMVQRLKARTEDLAQSFDRELTRAAFFLSLDPETLRDGDFSRYAARYERWHRTAVEPTIVKGVFYAQRRDDGRLDLTRFEPEGKTFRPAPWPEAMAGLEQRLARPPGSSEPRSLSRPFDPVLDDIPALVVPAPPAPSRPNGGSPGLRRPGFTVVLLDLDVVRDDFLPRLVRRHFGEGEASEFDVVVFREGEPATVFYPARGGAGGASSRADFTTGLFGLRPGEVAGEESGLPLREAPSRTTGARPAERLRADGRRPFGHRFLRGMGSPAGRWRISVFHREGSLDAVVAAARRRNLGVSFGILALLGTSATLIALSARRSRRLAARQMEFVAGVSHELRTPISVICSAGENLADGVVGGSEPVRRYGALVRDEGRRLGALVEQVLDFAGSYAGRRSYRRDRLEAATLVDAALAAARFALGESGARVEREVPPGLPPLQGDLAALTRALRNLIENALKYGGDGHYVAVRVSTREAKGRCFVRFAVEDRGLGIPRSELRQVFEPFYRSHEAQARQIRGSGLGLALVRSIVRGHDGLVTVTSESGRGSTFSIELPAARRETLAAGPVLGEDNGIAHPAG